MEKTLKKQTKTISLLKSNWEKLAQILYLSNGKFRSRSHIIEYSLTLGISINEILIELQQNDETQTDKD